MPIPSRPTVALQRTVDRSFYTLDLSYTDSLILLALALFLAVFTCWVWIKNKMTVEELVTRFYRLLALVTTLAEQLSYLRLSTLLGIATAALLDADDARPRSPPSSRRVSNPVSTAPRFEARSQRSLGVNSRPTEIV